MDVSPQNILKLRTMCIEVLDVIGPFHAVGIRTGGTSTMAGKAAVGLGQTRIMGMSGKRPGTVSVGIY